AGPRRAPGEPGPDGGRACLRYCAVTGSVATAGSGGRDDHVGGLQTLLALLDVEGDLVALVEVAEARALDGGEVHEHVRLTAALFDEAEALLAAEPLDLACCHVSTISQPARRRALDLGAWGPCSEPTCRLFLNTPRLRVRR